LEFKVQELVIVYWFSSLVLDEARAAVKRRNVLEAPIDSGCDMKESSGSTNWHGLSHEGKFWKHQLTIAVTCRKVLEAPTDNRCHMQESSGSTN
jgi:hypothetical protein